MPSCALARLEANTRSSSSSSDPAYFEQCPDIAFISARKARTSDRTMNLIKRTGSCGPLPSRNGTRGPELVEVPVDESRAHPHAAGQGRRRARAAHMEIHQVACGQIVKDIKRIHSIITILCVWVRLETAPGIPKATCHPCLRCSPRPHAPVFWSGSACERPRAHRARGSEHAHAPPLTSLLHALYPLLP